MKSFPLIETSLLDVARGMTPRLLLVTGSTRRRSTNTAVVHTARELIGEDVATVYDALTDLPPFDLERDGQAPPQPVAALRSAVAQADAVVFCTPEYGGRVPDSLTNLLCWAREMDGKPAAWINAVGIGWSDAIDTALARALRRVGAGIMSTSGVCVPVSPSAIDGDGLIADAGTRARLAKAFAAIVAELRGLTPPADAVSRAA